MTDDPGSLPRAGWYPDPADPTGRRYWDGHSWTEHTLASAWDRPTPSEQPEAASQAAATEAGTQPEPTAEESEPIAEPTAGEPQAHGEPVVESGEPGHADESQQITAQAQHEPVPADEEPQPESVPGSDQPGPGAVGDVSLPQPSTPGGWTQPEAAASEGWTQSEGAAPGDRTGPAAASPSDWSQPSTAAPAPVPYPGYETYQPQSAPLTNSGMRRVAAMFTDMGRILKRAWWQIIVISLAIWVAWSLIAAAITATLVDFGRLTEALNLAVSAANEYPNGRYPEEVADQIRESFEAVPRTTSVWVWVLVALVIIVLYGLAASLQVVAVNRLGMDAAAGHQVRLGPAVRSGLIGGVRLFGYYLLFTVLLIALLLIVALLIAATSSIPPLLVLLLMVVMVGSVVLSLFLVGRLAPITAQVALGRGALGWTWRATRTKFWGVLGRYLLWALVAGVIGQVVLSIVSIPLFLASTASLAGAPAQITPTVAVTWGVMMVLSLVISAITYVGIVPIWRDLTDDPEYRSIADGQPLPDPA